MAPRNLCWLSGARKLAIYDVRNQRVVILDDASNFSASNAIFLASHYSSVSNIAVSLDGKWLAGSGHHEPAIQIWNLLTNERIEIPHGDGKADVSFAVSFSPDGRWLISTETAETTATGNYFFETATWQRVRFQNTAIYPGVPAFSKDGRSYASMAAPQEVMITESETGRTLTQFRVSDERLNPPLEFLGQRSVLAVVSGGHDVALWNLASISDALDELGVPWDASLQAVAEPDLPKKSLEIIVDQGTLPVEIEATHRRAQANLKSEQATQLATASRYDESSTVFSEAMALAPNLTLPLNDFAWMLVTRPDHNAEHAKQAAEMAQRAVNLEPQDASHWKTLGVAQYRNGEFRATIDSLEKAESLKPLQWFSTNAYFTAMAHWQLGEAEEAHRWYTDAVKDHEARGQGDEELAAFRSEAEALIPR